MTAHPTGPGLPEELSSAVAAARSAAASRIAAAGSSAELKAAQSDVLGKRSDLALMNRRLGSLSMDQRRQAGALINSARAELEALVAERLAAVEQAELAARLDEEWMDLTEVIGGSSRGHAGIISETRAELEDVFVGMGFSVAEGPEVETDWYNFEALNFPPGHPARDMQDSLYLRLGEPGSVLLRTHTSPVQVRLMQDQALPIYSVMPGRVFRRDTPDARHLAPAFHQIEGLVVDRGISFAHLAGTIEEFTGAYFGPGMHSRLRPAFFPFTEPSGEFEVTCTVCGGDGCRTCSGTGWIELGGCGMVHPLVFEAVGIDPEAYSGFAFGFGIDRLAQMRYGIEDMRQLLDNDIRLLRQL